MKSRDDTGRSVGCSSPQTCWKSLGSLRYRSQIPKPNWAIAYRAHPLWCLRESPACAPIFSHSLTAIVAVWNTRSTRRGGRKFSGRVKVEIQYTECVLSLSILRAFRSSSPFVIALPPPPPSNPHYSNEYPRSSPSRIASRYASFYWKAAFPLADGPSEIAGKFFTSDRHESYNSTIQRGRSGSRKGENESLRKRGEQCANRGGVKYSHPRKGREKKAFTMRFHECYFYCEMIDANT